VYWRWPLARAAACEGGDGRQELQARLELRRDNVVFERAPWGKAPEGIMLLVSNFFNIFVR
jgi:hypothetical protein